MIGLGRLAGSHRLPQSRSSLEWESICLWYGCSSRRYGINKSARWWALDGIQEVQAEDKFVAAICAARSLLTQVCLDSKNTLATMGKQALRRVAIKRGVVDGKLITSPATSTAHLPFIWVGSPARQCCGSIGKFYALKTFGKKIPWFSVNFSCLSWIWKIYENMLFHHK